LANGSGISDSDEGRLAGRFALIGRDPRCDIRLSHRDVSSRHALLIEWGADLFCIDLGSRTGTRGLPGGKSYGWLTPDAPLQIGPHKLRLQARNHEGATPLAMRTILHQDLLPPDSGETACLEFLDEQIRPREYQLKRVLTLIGRHAPCRIQLRDSKISRVHCALFLAEGELWVIDLLGRGGTYVDGKRVGVARLEPGQFLQVGPYRARVKSIGAERLPLAAVDVINDIPTQEFITRLLDSQMITAEELSSVLEGDTEAVNETPRLQSALVKAGKLTPWAMRQLRRNPVPDLMLGKRYRLLEPLARGGMAVVYRGFDTRLHRPVALKVVRNRTGRGGRSRGNDCSRKR
jgi:pSer/pThr/pTyr-binding forkhead associated (FHA) protein